MRNILTLVLAVAFAASFIASPASAAKKKSGPPTRVEQATADEQPAQKRGCSQGGFRNRTGGSGAAYWSSAGAKGGC